MHNTRRAFSLCNPRRTAAPLSPRVLIVNMSDDEDYYIFKPPLELIRPFCAASNQPPLAKTLRRRARREEPYGKKTCLFSDMQMNSKSRKKELISVWWI